MGTAQAGYGGPAFEELDFDLAGYVLLGYVDKAIEGPAQRCEPFAIVDQLRVAQGELLLVVSGVAVEGDAFEGAMGFV